MLFMLFFLKMHLNKQPEMTSDSCIFLLGWACSVLQLRTNHDLEDIPKLWAQLWCSNLTIYQQCYFWRIVLEKQMDLHLLHKGIPSLLTHNKRAPRAFACSNPLVSKALFSSALTRQTFHFPFHSMNSPVKEAVMNPMLSVSADSKPLEDQLGFDLIPSLVLSSLAMRPTTSLWHNVETLIPFMATINHKTFCILCESHTCKTNSLWLVGA